MENVDEFGQENRTKVFVIVHSLPLVDIFFVSFFSSVTQELCF